MESALGVDVYGLPPFITRRTQALKPGCFLPLHLFADGPMLRRRL